MKAATEQLSLFNWDTAYELYKEALEAEEQENSGPWTTTAQEAAFGAAVSIQHASPSDPDRVKEASDLFEKLADAKLKSPLAARSLINLGRIAELSDYYEDVIDLPKARTYYSQVIERFGGDEEIAAEATLRLAAAFVQSYKDEDVRQGVTVLEKWLASHPDGPLVSAMWQYLGDTYFFPLNEFTKSLAAYVNADRLGWLDDADIGRLWWRMANLGEKTSNLTAAITFYTRIITDAPTSGKAYESQLALKRLGAPVPEITVARKSTVANPNSVGATTAPSTRPTTRSTNNG